MKIPWECKGCGATGEVDVVGGMGREVFEAQLEARLSDAHLPASAACTSLEFRIRVPMVLMKGERRVIGRITGWTA